MDNNEIKLMLSAILENQQITNAKLDSLEKRVARLEDRVMKIEDKVMKIEDRVMKIENKMMTIEERIVTIETTMVTKKDFEKLSSDETLSYLVKKSGEHEKDIYVLKYKQEQLERELIVREGD